MKSAFVVGFLAWNAPVNLHSSALAPGGARLATSPSGSNQLDVFVVSNAGAVNRLSVVGSGGAWTGPTSLSNDGIAAPGAAINIAAQGSAGQRDMFATASYGVSATFTSNNTWPALLPLP